jgi:hypothetical protein
MSDSLREALTSAFEAQETETPVAETTTEVAQSATPETAEQKADRIRDEKGRFAPKESAPASEQPVKANNASQDAATQQPAPVAEPRKPPSSWKKDYWEAYQKLDPQVADYINQREQQFASGVSTYREEAIKAKELNDALAPFMPEFSAHGVSPSQWIRNMGTAHQTLLRGSPEQKLSAFQKLAQDYGVPIHAIQSGQVDPVMQYVSPLQEQVLQLRGQLTNWQQQQEQQQQRAMLDEIESFKANAPHFEDVRETMAGILQAGLAPDLKSAYDKAVRMNDDVWNAEQQRRTEQAEKQRRETEAAKVASARANAISPKGSTPVGNMSGSKQGLRAMLEEQVTAHLGGGRV